MLTFSRSPLKIIFAGTPEFAKVALQAILDSQHEILAVYTQPDKPAGRGLKMTASPVKQLANLHDLTVHQPLSLKDKTEQEILYSLDADVMVVAAYGMILPAVVLGCTRYGCINIHPSLLPRWRGAAPIQRTIFAGDAVTGVTIMQLDEGLDTGPILLQEIHLLNGQETSQTLHDDLAIVGANALIKCLDTLVTGALQPKEQNSSLATYANKISKDEARINWHMPAKEIEQMIRAFNPWPVAFSTWQEKTVRIWFAMTLADTASSASPGTIISASHAGIDVATGKGILRLLRLQLPGGKQLSVSEFYNSHRDELTTKQNLQFK